jgi:hypothetical protein
MEKNGHQYIDIGKLVLDGSSRMERLTHFNRYTGFKSSHPAPSGSRSRATSPRSAPPGRGDASWPACGRVVKTGVRILMNGASRAFSWVNEGEIAKRRPLSGCG